MSQHTIRFCILIGITLLFAGCSAPEPLAGEGEAETVGETDTRIPGWFPAAGEVESEGDMITGYATALAFDSAAAARKGVERGNLILERYLSSRLEEARREVSGGQDSGAGSGAFIHSLRQAEAGLAEVAEERRTEVRRVAGSRNSWRAFTEVSADRNQLIGEIDRRLSEHGAIWNRLKRTSAFSDL